MFSTAEKFGIGAVVALIAVVFVGGCGVLVAKPFISDRHETITVKDKERIQDGDSSKYLIYAEEGVYENTDEILLGKTESSDLYNELEPGHTYDCKVIGWRISLFSMYPNLVDCDES